MSDDRADLRRQLDEARADAADADLAAKAWEQAADEAADRLYDAQSAEMKHRLEAESVRRQLDRVLRVIPRPTPADCQEVVMIEPVFTRFLDWADSQGWDVFRIPLEDDDPDALPAYAISPRALRNGGGHA